MDEDIKQKVQAAIAAGADPTEANQRGLTLQSTRTAKVTSIPEQAVRTETPQPSLGERLGQGIIDVGKGIVKPFVESAKNIGAATMQVPMQAMNNSLTDVALSTKYPEWMRKIAQKELDVTTKLTPEFRTNQELSNPEDLVRKQIGDSLEIGAWAVPFGKGANVVTKVLAPGAVMGGMTSAGSTISQDKAPSLPEIVGNTAIGAGTGMVTAGTLQSLGEMYNAVKLRGTSGKIPTVEKNINAFKMENSARDPLGEANNVNDAINRNLGQGSAMDKLKKFPTAMTNINDQINTDLSQATTPLDLNKIKSNFTDDFLNNTIYGGNDPKVADAWNELLGKVDGISGNTPAEVAQSAYKLKSELPIAPIMKKIGNSTPLTPIEEARYSLWSTLKNSLDEVSPEIKQLNSDQHLLILSKEGLIKSAEKAGPSVPIPGTLKGVNLPISNETAQNISSKMGSVIPNLERKLPAIPQVSKVPLKVLPLIISNVVAPSDMSVSANDTQQTQNNDGQYNTSGNLNHDSIIPQTGTNVKSPSNTSVTQTPINKSLTGHTPEEIYKAVQNAQNAGDLASVNKLRTMYNDETAYQKGQVPKTAAIAQTRAKTEAKNGLTNLNVIKTQLGMVDANGNDTGKLNRDELIKDLVDPRVHPLETAIDQTLLAYQAARAARGATGNPVSLDFLRKEYGINAWMPEETMRLRLTNLEKYLNDIQNEPTSSDVTTNDYTLSAVGQ